MIAPILPPAFRTFLVERCSLSTSTAGLYAAAVTAILRAGKDAPALAEDRMATASELWRCASDIGWRRYRQWCRDEGVVAPLETSVLAVLDAFFADPAELPPAVAAAATTMATALGPLRLLRLRWRHLLPDGAVADDAGDVDGQGRPLSDAARERILAAAAVLLAWATPRNDNAFVVPLAPGSPRGRGQVRLRRDIARGARFLREGSPLNDGVTSADGADGITPTGAIDAFRRAAERPPAARAAGRHERALAEAKARNDARLEALKRRVQEDPASRFEPDGFDEGAWLDVLTGARVDDATRRRVLREEYGMAVEEEEGAGAKGEESGPPTGNSPAAAAAVTDAEALLERRLGRPLTDTEKVVWGFAIGQRRVVDAATATADDLDELV